VAIFSCTICFFLPLACLKMLRMFYERNVLYMTSENRFWWPCGLRRKSELISGIPGSNPSESIHVSPLCVV